MNYGDQGMFDLRSIPSKDDIVLRLQKMLKLDAANVISVLKKIWFQL